ncbi:GNAT family N-acetyltransferase [Paenibacillus kyungheensis]|uniref:GNAT family N-acetyltransferase n=1 Tax=Paenibacillus kyungheensis TaxID=1452732 RepID=A0AAX3M5J5_9BACL|nr:GNAT family N-acetyltransferase [Paenibacillus kyungheensis]WCT57203.1 GNAT family N-acetyltransferase [Paenibacillus kyungheensis]
MYQSQLKLVQASSIHKEQLAELRAMVLQEDLTRLGRFDEHKVRQRFRNAFDPSYTWLIEVEGKIAGCVALKPEQEGYILEHFYMYPDVQGHGIGSQTLRQLLARPHLQGKVVHLNVLQGSPAQRLYERFGFELDSEDEVDIFMSRTI